MRARARRQSRADGTGARIEYRHTRRAPAAFEAAATWWLIFSRRKWRPGMPVGARRRQIYDASSPEFIVQSRAPPLPGRGQAARAEFEAAPQRSWWLRARQLAGGLAAWPPRPVPDRQRITTKSGASEPDRHSAPADVGLCGVLAASETRFPVDGGVMGRSAL